jgi:hypothetical protein
MAKPETASLSGAEQPGSQPDERTAQRVAQPTWRGSASLEPIPPVDVRMQLGEPAAHDEFERVAIYVHGGDALPVVSTAPTSGQGDAAWQGRGLCCPTLSDGRLLRTSGSKPATRL